MTEEFVRRSRIEASPDEVYAWHARPGAFERLNPPWGSMRLVAREGGIEEGARTELRVRAGPIRRRWISVHGAPVPGREFGDVQEAGPFRRWAHTHRFAPAEGGACTLEDHIVYELPLGAPGRAVAGRAIRRSLERTFAYRHRVTQGDLALHRRYGLPPLRIAVTGSHGLVGSQLWAFLSSGGHSVARLVRGAAAPGEIVWDPEAGRIDAAALEGADAVVHLAGETIGGRFTKRKKAAIMQSRERGTRLLASSLARLERPPRALVCASAVGFYGDRGDELLTEESRPGEGFLAEVVRAWEGAADPARAAGIRVVHLRFGIVLSPAGGALARLLLPFRLGLGGRAGSGRQWWSWVAIDDVLGAVLHAIATEALAGPANACSPEPARNADFSRTLARVLRRPALMPLPAAVARAALGEVADEMVLAGQRAEPARLVESGYRFLFPELDGALRHVLGA